MQNSGDFMFHLEIGIDIEACNSHFIFLKKRFLALKKIPPMTVQFVLKDIFN